MHVFATNQRGAAVKQVPLDPAAKRHLAAESAVVVDDFFRGRTKVPYEPGYDPAPDEILWTGFTLPPVLQPLAQHVPASVKGLDVQAIKDGDVQAIVIAKQDGTKQWIFQAVDSKNFLRPQSGLGTVLYGNGTFELFSSVGLALGSRIDAVYQGSRLYFRSEHQVRRFLDLSAVFTAMTNDGLSAFFGRAEFEEPDVTTIHSIANTIDRRKLARVARVLGAGHIDVVALRRAAQKLAKQVPNLSVSIRLGKIVVPDDKKEFVELVRLLNDDYVESSVDGSRKFFAGSKRTL